MDKSPPGAADAPVVRDHAYLAHGEVPGSSPEFGLTVQGAIDFLMRQPKHEPMASHALAEAYGMTLNPNLKVVALKSLKRMVDRLIATPWGPGRDGDGTTDTACCPVRSNYWAAMVLFNHGGKRWERCNKAMKEVCFKGQEAETGKCRDQDGKELEVGCWHCEGQQIGPQPIMPTCCIVQLMVYCRCLPTGSKEASDGAAELHATATDPEDIRVDVGTL
jgi:hypothetical protein